MTNSDANGLHSYDILLNSNILDFMPNHNIVSLHSAGQQEAKSFLFKLIFKFIFWLRWVFVASCGLSLDAASWSYSSTLCCGARASHCCGFSCCRARALSTWASVVVAHRL